MAGGVSHALFVASLVGFLSDDALHPSRVQLALAAVAGVASCVLVPHGQHARYVLPVVGGKAFSVVATTSWLLLGLFAAVCVMGLVDVGLFAQTRGLVGGCAGTLIVAKVAFHASMGLVDEDAVNAKPNHPGGARPPAPSLPLDAVTALAVALQAGSVGLFLSPAPPPPLSARAREVALVLCLASAALVHTHAGPAMHSRWRWFQPFVGGWRFVLLQATAYVLLGATCNLVLGFAGVPERVPAGLGAVTAATGVASFAVLVASLPYFHPAPAGDLAPAGDPAPAVDAPRSSLRWEGDSDNTNTNTDSAAAGKGKVAAGRAKGKGRSALPPAPCTTRPPARLAHIHTSLAILLPLALLFLVGHGVLGLQARDKTWIVGALGAVMLVGPVAHVSGARAHAGAYHVFGPLEGGFNFMCAQALGWMLYALTLLSLIVCIANGTVATLHSLLPIALFSNLTLHCSVPLFTPSPSLPSTSSIALSRSSLRFLRAMRGHLITFLFVHAFHAAPYALATVPFALLPFPYALALVCGLFGFYRLRTPDEFSGAREWPAFGSFARRVLPWVMQAHPWVSVYPPPSIARAGDGTKRKVVFACHPHGVLPVSWAISFTMFNPLRPLILMADVAFRIPITREMGLWLGCINASPRAFHASGDRALLVLPGGVREMGYSNCDPHHPITVVRRRGFIREAMRRPRGSRTLLVPVFGFGVDEVYSQVVVRSEIAKSVLGVYPFMPAGRFDPWTPRVARVCHVPGEGVEVEGMDGVDDHRVVEVCERFYAELARVVERHVAECPHHRHVAVRFVDGW